MKLETARKQAKRYNREHGIEVHIVKQNQGYEWYYGRDFADLNNNGEIEEIVETFPAFTPLLRNTETFYTVGSAHSVWLWTKTQSEAETIAARYRKGDDADHQCDENSLQFGIQVTEWLPGTWEDVSNGAMQLVGGVPTLGHHGLIKFA